MRTTNGIATSACTTGTIQGDERKSIGSVSNAMRKPKPSITADAPSGSMRARRAAALLRASRRPQTAARPPTTSAIDGRTGCVHERVHALPPRASREARPSVGRARGTPRGCGRRRRRASARPGPPAARPGRSPASRGSRRRGLLACRVRGWAQYVALGAPLPAELRAAAPGAERHPDSEQRRRRAARARGRAAVRRSNSLTAWL